MKKRSLQETLQRWKNTSRFRVIVVGDLYELRLLDRTLQHCVSVFVSELELTTSYGSTWRYILGNIIKEMRYNMFHRNDA